MKHYGDITKLSGYDLPVVDVITGGSPCQDLSVAGKREGLEGERSGLFMEQIRIVKEMREHDRSTGRSDEFVRPRFMVWENVIGAFSSNKGRDFQTVLTEIVKIVEPNAPDVPLPSRGGTPKGVSTPRWENGQLLGEYMTRSFGDAPSTLMEECSQGERHNGVSVSRLSQILMDSPPQKYYLSAKACSGILRRAEKRGKELPEQLRKALERQSAFKNEQENPGGAKEY